LLLAGEAGKVVVVVVAAVVVVQVVVVVVMVVEMFLVELISSLSIENICVDTATFW